MPAPTALERAKDMKAFGTNAPPRLMDWLFSDYLSVEESAIQEQFKWSMTWNVVGVLTVRLPTNVLESPISICPLIAGDRVGGRNRTLLLPSISN